ncbi:AraC family transcriptional regulator [Labrenzia sp. DG1229]|uniref:AraC family transcriptional regulator n=1 Tax=Labrenzia sp. DG1229 TaxID=681847 RepID=UPI000568ECE6|nr:AraC family transcriptional regulator [Labrenzia sp. DG1229]
MQRRLTRVLDEIDHSLDRPLDITGLAEAAAFSRFHFQRQFSVFLGMSVAEYRRLLLMKRAGNQLVYRPEEAVTDIAYDAGYENLESFSRAFKRAFGQTPSDFRATPDWDIWHETFNPLTELKGRFMPTDPPDPDNVKILEFPETRIAIFEHTGPQAGLSKSVQHFISWRRENSLPPLKHATFNILYDDPKAVAPCDYRFGLCCEVTGPVPENGYGIRSSLIPGGRCAVLPHMGSLDFAENAIRFLYRDWLPQSGEHLRDFPLFVKRLKFFPDVPEHETVSEVYLPLL